MNRPALLSLFPVLMLACTHAVHGHGPAQTPIAAPPASMHEHTFANLKARLGDVTSIVIVPSDGGDVLPLAADEIAAVRRAVARCTPADNWAATPPPWSAVFRASAPNGDEWYFQLTATVLRMDRANPRAPSLSSIHSDAPTVQDCALHEGDDPTVWSILEARLGSSEERSYLPVPAPSP